MKSLIKPAVLLLCLAFSMPQVFAQDEKKAPGPEKKENIIIRKKGDSKEKMTIIIDGDKVTVNGKPVEDFRNDNVEVIVDEDMDVLMPRMAFAGDDMNMMNRNIIREIRSNKAFLGVMTKKSADGAEITEVTKESAAEQAGLKPGDIITKINDDKVTDADDLYKSVGKYKPQDKVTITYKRAGKENKSTVTLGENKQVKVYSWNNGGNNQDFDFKFALPAAPGMPFAHGFGNFSRDKRPRLGMQVQETEDNKGVKVLDVDDESPAGEAGIKEDDIITSINGKAITSIDALKDTMKDAKDGDTVKLELLRDGKTQTINVKFPKELKTTDL